MIGNCQNKIESYLFFIFSLNYIIIFIDLFLGSSLTLFTLREYVDRLQLLKSPEERQRRISEVPEIHADPTMNPSYESEEDTRNGVRSKKGTSIVGHGTLGNVFYLLGLVFPHL